jgi:hypothetical protein
MNESFVKVLNNYATAFRALMNEKVLSSSRKIKELLRLNKEEDWGFICTAMDIVDDASTAIRNFLQFGLDGPTKYEDMGERYLRLYGVLNATYIQQQAILNLYRLMNVPNLSDAKKKIGALKIREVRHKVGAHSNDYINSDTDRLESFVPVRLSLSLYYCQYVNSENLVIEGVDLKESLEEHLTLMIELLDKSYEKTVRTLYKSDKKKVEEFHKKLCELRIVRDGGVILDIPGGRKLIIHTMRQ